ncbi:Ferredoxin--NADP reductase [Moorella humiferrea]|uniref:Ferredoxin 7Fe n=2 Tax=Neomoorella humiferrea TaxID=676965 RepID=A0A2T0AQR6_9FIRM|nr:Ferredoxin 7Fe [Moorella humiferrea]
MDKESILPVAVLGAGIAGVQAAIDLSRLNYKVILIERADRPGGKLAVLPKTFPTNDCSACALTPQDGFFCIRSPYFLRLAGEDRIVLLTGAEVKKVSGEPGHYYLYLSRNGREEVIEAAAVILCPGYEEYLPPVLKVRYGYGRYDGVLTGLELERQLAANGYPRRFPDDAPVEQVAFIQCAGSRDPAGGAPYCSAVCCMYALKEAMMLYESAVASNLPLPKITIFYMDLRTYGKTYQEYLDKARKKYGLRLVRSRIHSIVQYPGESRLLIRYVEEDGRVNFEEFDLAVLATGLRPPDGARDLAGAFGIAVEPYGFCQFTSLNPSTTTREGIFFGGAFGGPCDVIDAVNQGSAAAAACASWLKKTGFPSRTAAVKTSCPVINDTGEALRMGVFICTCDILSTGLDLHELEEYSRKLPGVAVVEKINLCDEGRKEHLMRAVKEHRLNGLVLAACSARALEPMVNTFLEQAGLPANAARTVNVLEHAARLYNGRKDRATQKAKELLGTAAAMIGAAPPVTVEEETITPAALVVGGGVAGMTAALTLAELGCDVHLVEKEGILGGNARRLRHTLQGVNVKEYLDELIGQVREHPRIRVHLNACVRAVSGGPGNFTTEIEIEDKTREVIDHGVTVIAIGAEEKKPRQYLYGNHQAVMTGLALEEALGAGKLSADNLQQVVFIQCVESRDDGHPYCSRVCCGTAIKNALELKRRNPDVKVYVINRDIMTYGLQEQWYEAARAAGVLFLRYNPDTPPEVAPLNTGTDGKVQIRVKDSILDEVITIEADLLILSTGMEPRADSREVASLYNVSLDDNGFFASEHPKLKTVETAVPGIFTCGLAESPKNLEETIASARAAAVKAAALVLRERRLLPARVARVEGDCAACLTCVRVCPYGAPAIQEHRSYIDPLLCRGCGACVAACPARAITLTGYSHEEVEAGIKTLAKTNRTNSSTIVFTCSYCAYANFENAVGWECQKDVSVIQVPCLSRIGTLEVLKALEAGAAEIILTGCVEGQCHFRPARAFGSRKAMPEPMFCQEQAWRRVRKILGEIGMDAETVKVWRLPPPMPDNNRNLAGCLG